MDRTHEYDVRLFRSPANLRRHCFHEIDDRPAGRRVRGSSLRLCRPPVETMHGPAGIPETRFHFRQKCLRLGRVGNTCTRLCADKRTQRAQHKRRVFITFRGKEGQSHFSYRQDRRLILAGLASRQFFREEWGAPARHSLAASAVATARGRRSGHRFRSPTAHAGSAACWKSVAVAIFLTAHLDTRGRSLGGHPIPVHRKNSGLGG